VDALTAKGVGWESFYIELSIHQGSEGRLFLNIPASSAEFETDVRRER
jgi:hypothetical protein